jgi:hypothetical protein
MFGLMMLALGVIVAIKAMDMFRAQEGSEKVVETAKDKSVDYIDRLWK